MNGLDIAVVALLVVGIVFGYMKGFSLTASFAAGSFFGCWASSNYYDYPARFIPAFNAHPLIGYCIVFFAIFAFMVALGVLFNRIFKIVFLGWADKLSGAVLGAVLSISIVGTLLVPLELAKKEYLKSMVKNSVISKHIVAVTKKVVSIFPPKKEKLFDKNIQQDIQRIISL